LVEKYLWSDPAMTWPASTERPIDDVFQIATLDPSNGSSATGKISPVADLGQCYEEVTPT
jgi:hypothetical protein